MNGEQLPSGSRAPRASTGAEISHELPSSASEPTSQSKASAWPASEPSTPLRSTLLQRDLPTYSQPVRPSHQFTPLPRTQLGVLARQLEYGRSLASPRKLSRPVTPRSQTPTRTSLTPRLSSSRLGSPRHQATPASHERAAKRRRSSIVLEANGQTVFNPSYVGPVTLDYLRLLCKAVIEERERLPQKERKSSEVDLREYNEKGLPYPSNTDELLRLPFISASTSPEAPNPFYEQPNEGARTFSYLERILAAQQKMQQKEPEDVPMDTFPEVDESRYRDVKTPNQFYDNDDLDANLDEINVEEVHLDDVGVNNDQAGLVTPSSASPGFDNPGIVQNDLIPEDQLASEADFAHADALPLFSAADTGTPEQLLNAGRFPVPRISKTRSKANKPSDVLSLRQVKNIVKGVGVQNSESSKQIKMAPEVLEFIHKQSDIFLLNVMSDLEAYAVHRTNGRGSTINMKDALLFINQLKLINDDGIRLKAPISYLELARNYLPLEQVMGLYNSLRPEGKGSNDNSEDDELQDRTLHLSGFSDSDSEL